MTSLAHPKKGTTKNAQKTPNFDFSQSRDLRQFSLLMFPYLHAKDQKLMVCTGVQGPPKENQVPPIKHVLMFQRVGACYPDWIIKPMSAKGFVKYVTDNQ